MRTRTANVRSLPLLLGAVASEATWHVPLSSGLAAPQVWDFPGHVDTSSAAVRPEITFADCGALVWVIDAQDDQAESLARLQATMLTAYKINPNIVFEVFVHKVDSFRRHSHKDDGQLPVRMSTRVYAHRQ